MNQEGDTMATKTANVVARVAPDVKAQAEEIMDQLGIPVSVVINSLTADCFGCDG